MSSVEKQLRAMMDEAASKARGNRAEARDKAIAGGEASLQEVLKQEAGTSDARLGGYNPEDLAETSTVWRERLVAMREAPISLPAGAAFSTHALMTHLGLALEDGYNLHPVQWVSKYFTTPNKGLREACLRQSATMGLCMRQNMPVQCSDEVRSFTKCLRAQGVPATFDLSSRTTFQPVTTAPALPPLPGKGRLRGSAGTAPAAFMSAETMQQIAIDLDSKFAGAGSTLSSASHISAKRLAQEAAEQLQQLQEQEKPEPTAEDARQATAELASAIETGSRRSELSTLKAAMPQLRAAVREAVDRE